MGIADIANSPEAETFAASLAAKYDISPAAAQSVMAGLLPTLAGGIEANTMTRGGIADLMEALSSGHHQNVVNDPSLISHPDTIADGNAVIGHLLGPSGLSQAAVHSLAGQAGVPVPLLGQIAPVIAVWLLGYLFHNSGGMLGNIIGAAMGGGGRGLSMPQMPQMPPMGGSMGRNTGGGMMPPMPDLRNLGPGNNPYGNIANSIRNGGMAGGGTAGGVRDILGGMLGFGSNQGIMGWIIKFLILRFGMTILRGLLRNFIRV